MGYKTTSEMSPIWGISTRRIGKLCSEGRIKGAILKGKTWLIPENAEKPDDMRYDQTLIQKENKMANIKEGYLYDPVAKKQRKATDEEYVRQEMIKVLVQEYNYTFEEMETEFPIKEGSANKRIDIAIFNPGDEHTQVNVKVIVETKAPKISLSDKKDGVGQLITYVAVCPDCMYGLWTNGSGGLRQVVQRIQEGSGKVREVDNDIPRKGQEISADKGPKMDDLVPATSESLKWRFKKCHDIIATAGDDKMTAFWEFLKVIETKIEDEKEDKEYADFFVTFNESNTQDGINRVYNRINDLYKRLIVEKYDKYRGFQGDKINIRPASLARIVSELQNYSLLGTNTTIKGAAYEEIVGANLRGDKGEFFTPRVVIDAAVSMLEIEPDDICTDLACGSGGFVITMLDAGKKAIFDRYNKRKGDFTEAIKREQEKFATSNIIANDINRNLSNACAMNLMMNGVDNSPVFNQDILEPVQNWNCDNADELKRLYGLKKVEESGHAFYIGNITKIGANPPFGNNIVRTEEYVLNQFELAEGKTSQIVEILFLERIIQLLVPGKGRAAIVVPQSILNNPGLEYVRKWLFAHTKVLGVLELPVETFLISGREGTGTLTAVLVVERRELTETAQILDGVKQVENYPIFMAEVHKVGYDRRGKELFVKDEEGQEILHEVTLKDSTTTKEKVIDNDLPEIVNRYLEYSRKLKSGKVYYDVVEEIYRVL
ncbi:MAG: restriction endonuclease subunit M [Lachnospiraceae bacterium]|nr:restriction endonuclease subunit M [Lachnospiraceae bacterium]